LTADKVIAITEQVGVIFPDNSILLLSIQGWELQCWLYREGLITILNELHNQQQQSAQFQPPSTATGS